MYAPTYVHHIKSYKQIGTTIKPCIQTFTHIETLALSSTCTQTVTTRDRDSKVLSQIVRVNMKKMGKVAEATLLSWTKKAKFVVSIPPKCHSLFLLK